MMLALEAVEALCSGPSFLTADPMGPLPDQDEEEALSPSSSLGGEVPAPPPLSLAPSPYRTLPPPAEHPSSFLDAKAGLDLSALPWLVPDDLLRAHAGAEQAQDDAFAGMDWMSEKMDLGDLDLDSLIGSCSSDEAPASPEDPLACLGSRADPEPFPTQGEARREPPTVAEREAGSPGSPGFPDSKSPPAAILPEAHPLEASPSADCDSDSGVESWAGSPRAKPYARPPGARAGAEASSGAPKVAEKKLKKMEQNKTAATRYRQKKRVEQEQLNVEREALESRNRELAERARAIAREIQYLKDLVEEVRKHHRGKTGAAAK